MTCRRLLALTVLAALCAAAAAAPAEAAARHRPRLRISAVTWTAEGAGTLIRITYAGLLGIHTRILRSANAIDALAVTDVDNDGEPDIVAARQDGGLVLWRNAGRGRFIVAALRSGGGLRRHETEARAALHASEPTQSGDGRYSAAMPRGPDATADPIDAPHTARASSLVLSACTASPQGRAPPAILL